jgi:hypothetical protein
MFLFTPLYCVSTIKKPSPEPIPPHTHTHTPTKDIKINLIFLAIPPKRHPNTSLSSIDSTCMTSFIYSNNSISKSSTNLTLYSKSNNVNEEENNHNVDSNDQQLAKSSIDLSSNILTSNSSSLLTTSSLSINDSVSPTNIESTNNNNNNQLQQQQQLKSSVNTKILKKSLSINSENTSYMNFVLAQIGVYLIFNKCLLVVFLVFCC